MLNQDDVDNFNYQLIIARCIRLTVLLWFETVAEFEKTIIKSSNFYFTINYSNIYITINYTTNNQIITF